MIRIDSVVVRNSTVSEADLHDELVLLSIESDSYFGLKSTGRAIWEQLAAPIRVSALCDELARRYDTPASIVRKDTIDFLAYLEERALVRVQA